MVGEIPYLAQGRSPENTGIAAMLHSLAAVYYSKPGTRSSFR